MAYLAAILARAGHDVKWTRGDFLDGDVALVLTSIVDHKNETAWADAMRARGVKVGFIGITASKMPELFADHCDFILNGEPEAGVMRMAQTGEIPSGIRVSEQINDLDSLPFPRWIWSASIAARSSASNGLHGRSAAATRCSRAAAAPSSARIARTGFSPATAPGPFRTSSTKSSGCAIRCGGRTSSSAIRCSPSSASAASSCATRSRRATCISRSKRKRASIGWTSSCSTSWQTRVSAR